MIAKLGVAVASAMLLAGSAIAQPYPMVMETYPGPVMGQGVVVDPDTTGSIAHLESQSRQPAKEPLQYLVPSYQRGSGQQSGGPARELNPGWMAPRW
jgi:hypothetical protein